MSRSYIRITGGGGTIAGSGENITKEITQNNHGFIVKDVIGFNTGNTYSKAIADGSYNGEILGIVSEVLDSNTFKLTVSGYIDGLSGLIPNSTYFLSDISRGLLTPSEPISDNSISKAILISESSTSAWVLPYVGYYGASGSTTGTTVLSPLNNTKVLFNDEGYFGESENLTWNGTTFNINGQLIMPSISAATTNYTLYYNDTNGSVSYGVKPTGGGIDTSYQTLTSSASVTMDVENGKNAKITLAHNATLTLTNLSDGDEGNIIITQDSGGGNSINISPTPYVIDDGSGQITLTGTGNSIDILSYTYDGTRLFITYGTNYTNA